MTAALFSHALTLPPGFDERSVYLFYLEDAAKPAKGKAADAAAFAAGQLRPGTGAAGDGFSPNVVVTRERTKLSLEKFVAEQAKLLAERAPKMKLVKEGAFKVAGEPARQAELEAAIESPKLRLVQWQVVTLRDGFAYCFFSTTTRDRWEQDRPRFESFIAGWK